MPAISSSIYTVIGEESLEHLFHKLENIKLTEQREIFEETYTLRTVISDIKFVAEETLSGILSFEDLQPIPQIDKPVTFAPFGRSVQFYFFYGAAQLYLVVFAKRSLSEKSAAKLNYILNRGLPEPSQKIFNYFFSTKTIENFLNNHPHIKKLVGWKDLNYPGVNKSSLHGANVDQFVHAQEYDAHGRKGYVMVELLTDQMVVRISESGVVTFYGNILPEKALEWMKNEIIP